MAQCRDLENHHHEKLLEISINTLEKIAKGDLDDEMPEDLRSVSEGHARHQVARFWDWNKPDSVPLQPQFLHLKIGGW